MKPKMEKMAKPAMKLVPLLRKQRARQSLVEKDDKKTKQKTKQICQILSIVLAIMGQKEKCNSRPVAVVVVFVVASQCSKTTQADGV